jgi:predicted enzyme related to lactoylglutathione lyase
MEVHLEDRSIEESTVTETAAHAPGTPIWVDLGSPDIEASKAFYGTLFGWDAFTIPDPQAGGYTMLSKNGKLVAGLGPLFNQDQPSAWSTYIAADDAAATAEAVRKAGGQVVMGPIDVMGAGHMAVFTDPAGAFISIWQSGEHKGAELFNEPGSICWSELATRDMGAAKDFYSQVFGWGHETNPMDGGEPYTVWKVGDRMIAGGTEMNGNYPEGVPPHWLTYFAIDDVDQGVRKVEQLGGRVIVPAMEIDPGRFSVVTDPHGAAFGIIQLRGA